LRSLRKDTSTYLPKEALMPMKNSNRTATSSLTKVLSIQGRSEEFPAKTNPLGFVAVAQKPVAVFFENENRNNRQLHKSVLILGTEEIFCKANLLPASTFNRSRQGRSCISVLQAKQAVKFKHRTPTFNLRQFPFFGSI
jgi:hypothetical protein